MANIPLELSLAAVDLLWEELRLGLPPALFELPSVGETLDDRARLRQIVHQNLPADARTALTTLARFDHAIEGVVITEDEPVITFRAATDRRAAVLAVKQNQMIRFSTHSPDGLVHAVLPLIGDAKPGPGRSISYPDDKTPDEAPAGILRPATPTGGYGPQRRTAQDILAKPRVRSGWFTVLGHGRTFQLAWFDTTDGRYVAHRRPGPDGRPWDTCSPADRNRIAQLLVELLRTVATT